MTTNAPATSTTAPTSLKRDLTRLDVVALGINGVIGSGIFFLPSRGAEQMGPAAILSTLAAGILCLLIALCFAEVGSRFEGTGGPYLYARAAFGDFVGFEVGWMSWWVGVTSCAALANAFILALSHFAPAMQEGINRILGIVLLMTCLTAINCRGVKWGAWLSNFFTAGKLIPLLLFVAIGVFFIDTTRFEPFAPMGYGPLGEVTLVILYAYVGFEALPVPAGEMINPKRSIPAALIFVMVFVTIIYLVIQAVAAGTVDDLGSQTNPLATSAETFLGTAGGNLIALGSLVSVLGVNAGAALVAPRRIYALAEQREMPSWLARLNPRFQTPVNAIVLSALISTGLALSGSYVELAVLSVVGRFLQYIPTCLATPIFRRRDKTPTDGFRLPLGPTIPALACLLSLILLSQAAAWKLIAGAVAMLLGVPCYLYFKKNAAPALS